MISVMVYVVHTLNVNPILHAIVLCCHSLLPKGNGKVSHNVSIAFQVIFMQSKNVYLSRLSQNHLKCMHDMVMLLSDWI